MVPTILDTSLVYMWEYTHEFQEMVPLSLELLSNVQAIITREMGVLRIETWQASMRADSTMTCALNAIDRQIFILREPL